MPGLLMLTLLIHKKMKKKHICKSFFLHLNKSLDSKHMYTHMPLDKTVYHFFISQLKHKLWVLKRKASMRRFL